MIYACVFTPLHVTGIETTSSKHASHYYIHTHLLVSGGGVTDMCILSTYAKHGVTDMVYAHVHNASTIHTHLLVSGDGVCQVV